MKLVAAFLFVVVAASMLASGAAASTPCTIAANCSGHANSVKGDSVTGCICECSNQWYGASCQFCPPGVDASKDCSACLPGYENFPFCSPACTIQGNCSSHATNVTGDDQTGCQCTCENQWYGAQCQACPPGVDASKNCAACLPGYENYPFCAKACTNSANCNGHASSVSGDAQTGCICDCTNRWTGAQCGICPPGVDPSQDCGACLPAYDNYPFCALTCTVAGNCSNHAATVTGNSQTGCDCTCRNQWYGAQCQACPPGVDPSQDCGACLPGYDGYPFCGKTCTIAANCNGHASSVSGDSKTGCKCTCTNSWAGGNCNYCPPNFNSVDDCASCAPGFTNYPYCTASVVDEPPQRVRHSRHHKRN